MNFAWTEQRRTGAGQPLSFDREVLLRHVEQRADLVVHALLAAEYEFGRDSDAEDDGPEVAPVAEDDGSERRPRRRRLALY